MGPKKVLDQSLFFNDDNNDDWADEVSALPTNVTYERQPTTSSAAPSAHRDQKTKIPDYPPFKLKFTNLSYSITNKDMEDLLKNLNVEKMGDLDGVVGHKGNTMVEFADRDSLVRALELDGKPFLGMNMRVIIPERRGGFGGARREGPPSDGKDRDFDNWDRRGPLPPMEGGDRPRGGRMPERDFDWNERRGPLPPMEGGDRPRGGRMPERDIDWNERRGPLPPSERSSKPHDERNYDSWERKGPLPPREDSGFQHREDREFKERAPRDERNYDNWEHRGPLPPLEDKKNDFGKGFRRQNSNNNNNHNNKEEEFDWNNRRGPLPPPEERKPHYHNRQNRNGSKSNDPFDQDWNASKPSGGVKVPENKPRGANKNTNNASNESSKESKETDSEAKNAAPAAAASSSTSHGPKKLHLLPRSEKAAEAVVPRSSALFGSAKPVDTASKFLEIEAREEQAKQERAKKAEEAAAASASKKGAKEDGVSKSFAALDLDDTKEGGDEHSKAKALEEFNQRRKEDLTEAEKIRLQEASPEELEGDGWNVVPAKRGGRR